METKTLILGNTDLTKYVNWPEQVVKDYEAKQVKNYQNRGLDETISKLEKDSLPCERVALDELKEQRERQKQEILTSQIELKYPILDTSFLSMHNKLNIEGQEIQLPKFSVYNYDEDNRFVIRFCQSKSPKEIYPSIYISGGWVPKAFKPLFQSLEIGRSKELFKKYKKIKFKKSFPIIRSRFNGLIPDATREKINESKKLFNHEDLYFITETKPEQWNAIYLTKDPLVVGVNDDKCYLIDKFDTTSLEGLIAEEFVE